MRNERTCWGVKVGFAWRTSAAAPATCGAEEDVPGKPVVFEQPAAAPNAAVETSLEPRRSGLMRPSIGGPPEPNHSTTPSSQPAAPTVRTEGDCEGSTT